MIYFPFILTYLKNNFDIQACPETHCNFGHSNMFLHCLGKLAGGWRADITLEPEGKEKAFCCQAAGTDPRYPHPQPPVGHQAEGGC